MQIDFHHGVAYVVARFAGMTHRDAGIVAYASQYVDDATSSGTIEFTNGAMYRRLSTAHKKIDIRDVQEIKNHLTWMPFHFLPGNGGLPAGQNPQGAFIEKIICLPNSHIAQDMARIGIEDKGKPYALHRLGITAHVFADTWAHQGFAGVIHKVNDVEDLAGPVLLPDESISTKLRNTFLNLVKGEIPHLGHGQAITNPDLPYAQWSYTNGLGKSVRRDNTTEFANAADELCKLFQCYLQNQWSNNSPGLATKDKQQLKDMFQSIQHLEGEDRHREWLDAIAGDNFGFGAESLEYISEGYGSWKHAAIGTLKPVDGKGGNLVFAPSFLTSDWKMFHDAAKAHRLCLVDDIFPKYGICAA